MCLAVPGEVTRIDQRRATVDFGGVVQQVLLDLLPDAQVGDYVLVHAGFAIQRLDPTEAGEILDLLAEVSAQKEPA